MIIPVRTRNSRDEYVICLPALHTPESMRDRMFLRAKVVEGSYAWRLIDDLYHSIFRHSLDLKADYEAYFALEYRSFAEYLRRRLRFSSSTVTALAGAAEEFSGVYYFSPYQDFLNEEYGVDFLSQLLEDSPAEEGQ